MDVATKLGIRVDNYTKYESGARIPRADRLIKLSKILGVSYDALNEGIERQFADLLKSHAIGVIVGESGSFSAFASDMENSGEAYYVVADFLNMGQHTFLAEKAQFFKKYINEPDLAGLIELYGLYSGQCNADISEQIGEPLAMTHFPLTTLDNVTAVKWAFCIAVKRYLERTDGASILDEAGELAGGLLEKIDALQFFAVKVFVPFLSFIIDAVELCMDTTIDDFGNAFLFYALTPPGEDDESGDDDEDY
jgi:transcriptional regulator with XRE-family HTH domain